MDHAQKHGTACKTCRRRGRKCDKTLPQCKACRDNGNVCDGYVFRWPGMAARGKFAGTINPTTGMKKDASTSVPDLCSRIVLGIPPVKKNEFCDVQVLVDYYAREITTVSYLGSSPTESPYAQYVLPFVKDVAPLRYAVAASAACHWAIRTKNPDLEKQSLYLRLEATKALRQRLQSSRSTDFGTLASMMMLAQLDMCSRDTGEFEVHLNGAKSIIEYHKSSSPGAMFFEQRLAWLDIVGCTTSCRIPSLKHSDIKATISQIDTPDGRRWSSDVFPCSVDLFECIADITILYKQQDKTATPTRDVLNTVWTIVQRIREWAPPSSMITSQYKLNVLEAWRFGILLYVVHLFKLYEDPTIEISKITNTILSHAKAVPVASGWAYSMLWSLLWAGLALHEREDEQRRENLRDHIEGMLLSVGCGGFAHALEILDAAWLRYGKGQSRADVISDVLSGPLIMA